MTDFVPIQHYQPKISQIQLFNHVLQNFDEGKGFRDWVFLDPGNGSPRQTYVVEGGCHRRATDTDIKRDVNDWLEKLDSQSHLYKLSSKARSSLTEYIILNSKRSAPMQSVRNIGWASEPGKFFNRLPWDMIEIHGDPLTHIKEHCPTFQEILERFTSPNQVPAFVAWIGSIMGDTQDRTQRGCILYGDGRNGKSSILRMLGSAFGSAMRNKECYKPGKQSSFYTDGIESARIICYAEVDDSGMYNDPFIKGVIGSDPIEVNRKGIPQFVVTPSCKVICATNKLPQIKNREAERRRWVFCDIAAYTGKNNPNYQEILNAEAQHIISAATRLYQSGDALIGSDIKVDGEALADVTDVTEANIGAFVDRFFELAPPEGEAWRTGWFLRSEDIANVISGGRHKISRFDVITHIRHRLGINSDIVRIDGKVFRAYKNIRIKQLGLPSCMPAEFGE